MSLLKCPTSVLERLEMSRRNFLWPGNKSKQKFHLVDWKFICRPRKVGGLGIRPLKLVNQALLGKWLWRLGVENDSLWFKVVEAKYGVSRVGWDVPRLSYCQSGLWRGFLSVNDLFEANIKFRIGDGRRVLFWLDVWAGDFFLADQFRRLFACAMNRQAKARDCMVQNGDFTHWGPIFRRDLSKVEEVDLFSLLEVMGIFLLWVGVQTQEFGDLLRMAIFWLPLSL